MGRIYSGLNVVDSAVERMKKVYAEGHRVVVSFSGGKDSTVAMEICVLAAMETNRLPVEIQMRDEEVMYPDTIAFAKRTWERPDISFRWYIANQPVVNIFDRRMPYFWTYDPDLSPEDWVQLPPDYAEYIADKNIENLVTTERYPVDEEAGQKLVNVIGIRVQESFARKLAIHSSKGFMALPKSVKGSSNFGVLPCRPIFDFNDGDVWKFIKDYNLDYSKDYDTMHRLGIKRSMLRIGPPTMTPYGIPGLSCIARAHPRWFDKVCERLNGVRSGVQFGKRAITPHRRHNESWEDCFKRTCIAEAPEWIAKRSTHVMEFLQKKQAQFSTRPIPEIKEDRKLKDWHVGSWKKMAEHLYNGDPFGLKTKKFFGGQVSKEGWGKQYLEPEFFKKGTGTWGGKPSW